MDMSSKQKNGWLLIGALCVVMSTLSGCSSKDDELESFITTTKKEPGGRVEPLPELKPYESYTYAANDMRSPFMPGGSGASGSGSLRPDSRRNREFLEQFSLDTLRMVGTLRLADRTYGLVKTKDGLVHRVLPGNFMGQADGKVTEITPSKISVVEIVPDGLGGYMERSAALALN
jgi:type IV pilus assembly protein PilP